MIDDSEQDRSDAADVPEIADDEDAPPPAPAPQDVLAVVADEDQPLPYRDLAALSGAVDETVRTLMALWGKVSPERRRDVLASLQRLAADEATLDFTRVHLSALHDADPATRILAIRGLHEEEREELAGLLADMLRNDAEATVRAEAAGGLGYFVVSIEFGFVSEEVADRLTDALRDTIQEATEEDEVRARALEAIGALSDESVGELIAEQYELGGTHMRLAAVRAMGRNAGDGWLAVLIQTFHDQDEDIRAAAARSAGQLLLEDAIDPLVLLIEDDEEQVQVAAIGALGEIAGETAERILTALSDRPEEYLADAADRALAEARLADFEVPAEGDGDGEGDGESAGDTIG